MFNFCTLFDSNYISRGLALFESLKKVSPDFHLYIVAFDEDCFQYLKTLHEPRLTVISLSEFEDEQLRQVKPHRTQAEYCWTCTPSVILYCIKKYQLASCTYVDADMIFYDDPGILFREMNNASVLLTEHRYNKGYDVSVTHGKYCVQFMFFKNDEPGLNALNWWRDRCLEWCFAYLEDGKFGDQKYLDDWPMRFRGVHVLQHPGGGLAPWNIQQYEPKEIAGKLFVSDKSGGGRYPVVFFHFHGLKFFSDQKVACCGALYEIDRKVKEIFYFPYIRRLLDIGSGITQAGFKRNPQGALHPSPSRWKIVYEYLRDIAFLIIKGDLSPFQKQLLSVGLHNHIYSLKNIK
jgi:hypothetical protein